MEELLSIEDIDVTNASAWNGIMIGTPAITAFMGAVHALERKLRHFGCKFDGLAIGVKEYEMREKYHASLDKNGNIEHERYLNVSRPLEVMQSATDKRKMNPPVMNQAYIDLKLHFLIKGNFCNLENKKDYLQAVGNIFRTLRVAGGVINSFKLKWVDKEDVPYGYFLRECTEEMMAYEGDNVLEKMIHALADEKHRYVVLANGFRSLTKPGHVDNQRDPDKIHVFAEQIYTLGEYIHARNIKDINEYMFHYKHEGISYVCTQNSEASSETS